MWAIPVAAVRAHSTGTSPMGRPLACFALTANRTTSPVRTAAVAGSSASPTTVLGTTSSCSIWTAGPDWLAAGEEPMRAPAPLVARRKPLDLGVRHRLARGVQRPRGEPHLLADLHRRGRGRDLEPRHGKPGRRDGQLQQRCGDREQCRHGDLAKARVEWVARSLTAARAGLVGAGAVPIMSPWCRYH